MSTVPDYTHHPGRHWESANLHNLLAHAGLRAPHTGQPISEPLLFLIANGIAAGYSFCPSVPGYGLGSGSSIAGRYGIYRTGPGNYADALSRLGVQPEIVEGSTKAAHKSLVAALDAGRPILVWTTPLKLTHTGWAANCGMFTCVVSGLDGDIASVGDYGATTNSIDLELLQWARNRVCSLKNRGLSIPHVPDLSSATLTDAVRQGLAACAGDMLEPHMKSYNLPGLLNLAKMLPNKSKRGWLTVYPGGLIYTALRDIYDSIETAGTGGALYRTLFAEGLEEAVTVLNEPRLIPIADQYHALADHWKVFADTVLTDEWPVFRRTKELLRLREVNHREHGAAAQQKIADATAELESLDAQWRNTLDMDPEYRLRLLLQLSEDLQSLHREELRLAQELHELIT